MGFDEVLHALRSYNDLLATFDLFRRKLNAPIVPAHTPCAIQQPVKEGGTMVLQKLVAQSQIGIFNALFENNRQKPTAVFFSVALEFKNQGVYSLMIDSLIAVFEFCLEEITADDLFYEIGSSRSLAEFIFPRLRNRYQSLGS